MICCRNKIVCCGNKISFLWEQNNKLWEQDIILREQNNFSHRMYATPLYKLIKNKPRNSNWLERRFFSSVIHIATRPEFEYLWHDIYHTNFTLRQYVLSIFAE
jgi:hypothetical protein